MHARIDTSQNATIVLLLVALVCGCGGSEDGDPVEIADPDTGTTADAGETDQTAADTNIGDTSPDRADAGASTKDADTGPSVDVYDGPTHVVRAVGDRYHSPPDKPFSCNDFCGDFGYECDTERALNDPDVETVGAAEYLEEGKLQPKSQGDLEYRTTESCSEDFPTTVDEWDTTYEVYDVSCHCIAPAVRTYTVDLDNPKSCKKLCQSRGLYCNDDETWGTKIAGKGGTLATCLTDEDEDDGTYEIDRSVLSCDAMPVEKGEDPGCFSEVQCSCTTVQ